LFISDVKSTILILYLKLIFRFAVKNQCIVLIYTLFSCSKLFGFPMQNSIRKLWIINY